jgi:hypothetical protein
MVLPPAAAPSVNAAPSASAVPVALLCATPLHDAVRRWVEGILGWQVVEDDPDGPVPPIVRILDARAAGGGRARAADIPTLLLVADEGRATEAARAVLRSSAGAILAWPSERDQLPGVVAGLVTSPRARRGATRTIRVGGAAGGVGTTTVVLALAGLAGWAGWRSLAAVGDAVGVRAATPVGAAALRAPDLWLRAGALDGVPGARVVVIDGPAPAEPVADRSVTVAVVDAGVDSDVDVLVCRPDAAARRRVPGTSAGAIVVVGSGPLTPDELTAAAGGRRVVVLPSSVRVARAQLAGRVPASLPGRWLRLLVPLLEDVVAPSGPTAGDGVGAPSGVALTPDGRG